MKTGICIIDVVSIVCPYCKEYQANPKDYSFLWTSDHIETLEAGILQCFNCSKSFKIPAAALKVIPWR